MIRSFLSIVYIRKKNVIVSFVLIDDFFSELSVMLNWFVIFGFSLLWHGNLRGLFYTKAILVEEGRNDKNVCKALSSTYYFILFCLICCFFCFFFSSVVFFFFHWIFISFFLSLLLSEYYFSFNSFFSSLFLSVEWYFYLTFLLLSPTIIIRRLRFLQFFFFHVSSLLYCPPSFFLPFLPFSLLSNLLFYSNFEHFFHIFSFFTTL